MQRKGTHYIRQFFATNNCREITSLEEQQVLQWQEGPSINEDHQFLRISMSKGNGHKVGEGGGDAKPTMTNLEASIPKILNSLKNLGLIPL